MRLINELADKLSNWPGIGDKKARRLAYFLIKQPERYTDDFAQMLLSLKEKVKTCSICFNYSLNPICEICNNPQRDKSIICVVSDPKDIEHLELTKVFKGTYHVLHGYISIGEGITPKHIKLIELLKRMQEIDVSELILAFDDSSQAQDTTNYIKTILPDYKITKPATGLSIGTELDYADEKTLSQSIKQRTEI